MKSEKTSQKLKETTYPCLGYSVIGILFLLILITRVDKPIFYRKLLSDCCLENV